MIVDTLLPEDFVRGRRFGMRGNIGKAIIIERLENRAVWTWVGTDNDGGFSYVSDIADACDWLGDMDMELLKRVENGTDNE